MPNTAPFPAIVMRDTTKNPDRFSAWIIIVITGIYVLSFPIHKSPIFIVIPVVAAGWFYRVRGGWIASIAAIFINLILINTYQEKIVWDQLLSYEGQNFFLVGHFFMLMAGISVGRLREVVENYTRAENALRASEERFRSLYENATIGIYSTTPDGQIILANPALVRMLGYNSFNELAARDLEKGGYAPQYSRSDFKKTIEKDGVINGLESVWIRKDGSAFYVLESAKAIQNTQGDVLRYEGTVEDITERKQAEIAARENEARFRAVVENSNSGVIFMSAERKIKYASPAYLQFLGYSPEELVGRLGVEYIHPEDQELTARKFSEVSQTPGKIVTIEYRLQRKDGSYCWVETTLTNLLDNPYVQSIALNSHNITERKQAEEKLQEREIRLASIFNNAADAIITFTEDQKILSFSKSAEKVFGYAEDEVLGKPLEILLPPRFADRHYLHVHDFSNAPEESRLKDKRYEVFGQRKSGVEFPAEASISKLNTKDNLIFAVFLRDITERKQAEMALQTHTRFLSLLNDMTHTIITAQDFNEVANTLANNITAMLEADSCYITRWDPIKEQVFPIATNNKKNSFFLNPEYPKGEKNLTTVALTEKRIIVVEDYASSPHANPKLVSKFTEKTFVSIPLIYGEHQLGAAIAGFNEYHQFTQEELEHAKQAGDQIALALWNMQQDIELQHTLRETQTLADIALALSETERIGLNNVLHLIVTSAQSLIANAEQSVIHLFNEKEQTLTSEAVAGFTDPTGGKKSIRLGEGIAGQVITSGETVNISDVNTDPRFVKLGTDPTYRSLMVAPVHSGKQNLGTISIQSNIPYAFTANDNKLLSQLGTQAAIAIENANLLESTKQALKEANALYRVNKGLISSLEPDDLLQDTVELLQKNFGYHYVQIYVADPDNGNFIMRAGSGKIGAQLKAEGYQLTPGEGIVGYTAETGDAFFTNDVDDAVSFVRHPLLPDTKSELAVPVKVGKEILGLLDIHQTPPKYLSQRDIQLVSAVADQLAIALQRADLYENLQISLQQEKAIRSQMMQNERLTVMGRLLATVSHELNNPLQAIQNALFLLQEEQNISPQGRQDLDIVLAESERMGNLIERLRATYRPTQSEDFLPTQINNIVEDVHALISTHLRHNQITFEFQPDPALPSIPALSDQIRQVTLNLFMNACEAMTSGGTLSVRTHLLADTNEVMLAVSDTGSGIPADMLPVIFEAFITNKPSGTGLGLTISHDIVQKHHGRISAENNPDHGATFTVWLPVNNGEFA